MQLCIQDIITPLNPCADSVPCVQYYNAACVVMVPPLSNIGTIANTTLDTILIAINNLIGIGGLLVKKVHLSSTDIKNSFTTHIQILPPLAGTQVYIVHSAILSYNFGTVAYTMGANSLNIRYGTQNILSDSANTNSILAQSVNTTRNMSYNLSATGNLTGGNIEIFSGNSNPTVGDGSLDAYLIYQVLTL